MKIEKRKISTLKPAPYNPRQATKQQEENLQKSLTKFGVVEPIIVNDSTGNIVGGHFRVRELKKLGVKDVDCVIVDLSLEDEKELNIRLNANTGGWDFDLLANGFEIEDLTDWGLEIPDFSDKITEEQAREKLTDKFIVPPFSVLDTRQGYWQERKSYWKELIGDEGESRNNIISRVNATVSNWDNKNYSGGVIRENSISILDPVLSELTNIWFGLEKGKTFDPFAGDSIFGFVSAFLGNEFTGIELRQEQADLNNARTQGMSAKYICDDGQNILNHIAENSQDLLFSCPPYFDLEIYSDLPNDASNQKEYKDFLKILDNAFTGAIKCLKNNRFAVITVGDVRDKNGFYYRFVDDVKDIFKNNGVHLYNEMVLIQATGNAALRANSYMKNRKVVKLHESVLVFFKGDPKQIKTIYPKIEINAGENMEFSEVD